MTGLPDPEMRRYLAPGTAELMPHILVPHRSRGLTIVSVDDDSCVVTYNGVELKFPTAQELKLTIRAVNKLLEEHGPKHEVKS